MRLQVRSAGAGQRKPVVCIRQVILETCEVNIGTEAKYKTMTELLCLGKEVAYQSAIPLHGKAICPRRQIDVLVQILDPCT
jgi:hypothetical protein